MTDERMGDSLWSVVDRLPGTDAGIVFRHYSHPPEAREELAQRVADIAKLRGLTLAIAGDTDLATRLDADLVHNPIELPCPLPFSRSVHSIEEAETARADGAALVFVSPVHPTSSHPGRKALGKPLALKIAKAAGVRAIALGGMNAPRFAGFRRDGFYGWAGIDAWIRR